VALYAVGDVQGCADEFEALLEQLKFDPARDRLWLVGDLVNRGPRSLDALRRVAALGDAAVVVLGNHDLHLLALARGHARWRAGDETLQPILDAPDRERLLDWLQQRPLLHHDTTLGVTMIHAGLAPQWDVAQARDCARELEAQLRGSSSGRLFEHMYGNEPDVWRDDLEGWDRLRFIVNAFTRLRICDEQDGRLLLKFKGGPSDIPRHAQPWFRIAWRRSNGARIVFGHWSAQGYVNENAVLGLDTGCVWGGTLTAQRLDVAAARPIQIPNRSGPLPLEKD
jgi:bis(5'-nucleosyl)-tetraphosphatase (symmetrical)